MEGRWAPQLRDLSLVWLWCGNIQHRSEGAERERSSHSSGVICCWLCFGGNGHVCGLYCSRRICQAGSRSELPQGTKKSNNFINRRDFQMLSAVSKPKSGKGFRQNDSFWKKIWTPTSLWIWVQFVDLSRTCHSVTTFLCTPRNRNNVECWNILPWRFRNETLNFLYACF